MGSNDQTRSIENLFVHPSTLDCALNHRCRPCCYKIVLHARTNSLPNQRPEMCPRLNETPKQAVASRVGVYDANHLQNILTIGDGNFSFSLSLARAFKGTNINIVATSHETRESVIETYPDGEQILTELSKMHHVCVHHGIDATNRDQMQALVSSKDVGFDRIIWNFPCVRVPKGLDGQNEEMERNKQLLDQFFSVVPSLLTPSKGQVHITHKTKAPFSQWKIEEIGAQQSFLHTQSIVFDRCLYPGYSNKKVLSKGSFPIWDSQTFVFIPQQDKEEFRTDPFFIPMTSEILHQVYVRLTPTIDEMIKHEAQLGKMKQRQTIGRQTIGKTKKRKAEDRQTPLPPVTKRMKKNKERIELYARLKEEKRKGKKQHKHK